MSQEIYDLLEKEMTKYSDLAPIRVIDTNEEMVNLADYPIRLNPARSKIDVGDSALVYVRKSVAERLLVAQDFLSQKCAGVFLEIVYGYRSLHIQQQSFDQMKKKLARAGLTQEELMEMVHRMVAVPDVAGHPTGGAVDVQLVTENGDVVDMGSDLHDFTKKSYVFYPFIPHRVWVNRQRLRTCMLHAGFAPFDGEWWHFSYGDKEWAFYYQQPVAFYNQIELQQITHKKVVG